MKLTTRKMLRKIKGNIGQEYLPIILPKTNKLLIKYLKKYKPKKILEVGTGIGYSTCGILATLPNCEVTTIEKDEMRISRAIYNFKKYGFFDRVHPINGDAKNALFSIDDKFDFIFLNSLETEYIKYLPDLKRLLKDGGIIFADNIRVKYLYDGDEIYLQDRNDKIVKEYLEAIQKAPFENKIYKVEEGIAVSKKIGKNIKRKNQEEKESTSKIAAPAVKKSPATNMKSSETKKSNKEVQPSKTSLVGAKINSSKISSAVKGTKSYKTAVRKEEKPSKAISTVKERKKETAKPRNTARKVASEKITKNTKK